MIDSRMMQLPGQAVMAEIKTWEHDGAFRAKRVDPVVPDAAKASAYHDLVARAAALGVVVNYENGEFVLTWV